MQLIPGAKLIELDLPGRIETELSADLPANSADAASLVQRRLRDGGSALQSRLTAAYQNVADAWRLGIIKIPAVIVERRYVIYGDNDVARAVARIDTFRGEQP